MLLYPKLQTTWVSFNLVSDVKRPAQGPFTMDGGQTSHDIRLAFALAIDKTKLASDICHNISCLPATGGLITKGLMGYLGDGNDPLSAFDAIHARALLAKADARLTTWYSLSSSTVLFVAISLATQTWNPPHTALGWAALAGISVATTVAILAVFISAGRVGPFRTAVPFLFAVAALLWMQRKRNFVYR